MAEFSNAEIDILSTHESNSFHEKAGVIKIVFSFSLFLPVDPNFLTEPPLSPSFHEKAGVSQDSFFFFFSFSSCGF